MDRRTEIPTFDVETYALETEIVGARRTCVPTFDVGSYARELESYGAELGIVFDLDAVPVWRLPAGEAPVVDYRVALLLLYVDGISTFETIIALSGLPYDDCVAGFAFLLRSGLVTTTRPGASMRCSRSARTLPPTEDAVIESSVRPKALAVPIDNEELWSFVVDIGNG